MSIEIIKEGKVIKTFTSKMEKEFVDDWLDSEGLMVSMRGFATIYSVEGARYVERWCVAKKGTLR